MQLSEKMVTGIVDTALGLMARRASAMTVGRDFTTADIVSAVIADPAGETAHYLATLIATGLDHAPLYIELAQEAR